MRSAATGPTGQSEAQGLAQDAPYEHAARRTKEGTDGQGSRPLDRPRDQHAAEVQAAQAEHEIAGDPQQPDRAEDPGIDGVFAHADDVERFDRVRMRIVRLRPEVLHLPAQQGGLRPGLSQVVADAQPSDPDP